MTPWTAARQASLFITIPEIAQTHVYRVSNAIEPSHPLLSSSLPAFKDTERPPQTQQYKQDEEIEEYTAGKGTG